MIFVMAGAGGGGGGEKKKTKIQYDGEMFLEIITNVDEFN
jgi:hypothetical protein